jgi:dienelactone hydrolase
MSAMVARVNLAARLVTAFMAAFVPILVSVFVVMLAGCDTRPLAPARVEVLADSLLERRTGEDLRLLRLADRRGTVHEAWLRRADGSGGPLQAVVILGGLGTGRRAVEIVPCPPGFALLGLDYPYQGPRRPTRRELMAAIGEIHRAAHATPPGVEAALLWLASRRDMDPRGAVVVGASFGVPFVLRGMADLPRELDAQGRDRGPRGVRAVALFYGGADLPNLARYRLRERPWWEREVAASTLGLFFGDLEPSRWVGRVSPRPLLLINGNDDEFVPRASARALERSAGEPKRQIWLPTQHVQPNAEGLLVQLVTETIAWLEAVERQEAKRQGAKRQGR